MHDIGIRCIGLVLLRRDCGDGICADRKSAPRVSVCGAGALTPQRDKIVAYEA